MQLLAKHLCRYRGGFRAAGPALGMKSEAADGEVRGLESDSMWVWGSAAQLWT